MPANSPPPFENWPRNQRSCPDAVASPDTLGALHDTLRDALANGTRPILARGATHSWSPLPMQEGGLSIDLSPMVGRPRFDRAAGTVTVDASHRLAALCDALAVHGVGLDCVPTVDTVTVAGAIATGAHAAHRTEGRFAEQVSGVRLIDGRGRYVIVDGQGCRTTDGAVLAEGGDTLAALRCHRGVMGVVHEVTLRVVPASVVQLVQEPMDEHVAFGPRCRSLAAFFERHEHAEVFWFPRDHRVLRRGADRTDRPPTARSAIRARLVDGMLRSTLASLSFRLAADVPQLARAVGWIGAHAFPHTTVLRDRSDCVATYLPGHMQRFSRMRTMEYGMPLDALDDVIQIVRGTTARFDFPVPMFMRRVGPRVFVEFIWPGGARDGTSTARRLEGELVRAFGAEAMPHEGKLYFQNPWPRVPPDERRRFESARRLLDPDGVFLSRTTAGFLAGGDVSGDMHA